MIYLRNTISKAKSEALKHPKVLLCLAAIPIFSFSKTLFSNIYSLTQNFFVSIPNLEEKYGQGSWAVVTGASDGIGREFCLQLARLKINIVLIARNKEKTEKVAKEIREQYPGTMTRVVIRDFVNSFNDGFFDDLYSDIRDLDISILVNNIGMCDISSFEKSSEKTIRDMIIVNCGPITLLSRKIIPAMLNRSKKSAIINLSSNSGVQPVPYMSLYSASKAFDDYLSRALALEFDGKIDILSMKPSIIRTAMTAMTGDSFYHINTDQFVTSALKKLGRVHESAGYWRHVFKRQKENYLGSEKKMQVRMRSWVRRLEAKSKN